ncbi:MAG: hypothetical protein ACPGQS_00110 [Bradymonadia bacterium]
MKAQYFQSVERIFLESTGRGLVVSDSDRYCIERWFSAGVPIEVVGRAVAASCSNRENPVRSLRLADPEVEKYFKAWKSRQVGSDRRVRSSYADGFDALIKRLNDFEFSEANRENAILLATAVERLKDLRRIHQDALTLQNELEAVERVLFDELWARVDAQLKGLIRTAASKATSSIASTENFEDDLLFIRMRNKKLREHFCLPVFEVQQAEAW